METKLKTFRIVEKENGDIINSTSVTEDVFEEKLNSRRDLGYTSVSTWVVTTEVTETVINKTLVIVIDGGTNDK